MRLRYAGWGLRGGKVLFVNRSYINVARWDLCRMLRWTRAETSGQSEEGSGKAGLENILIIVCTYIHNLEI